MVKIQVDNFGYKKGITILNNISLQIGDDEVFCLVGPNGAGKTTLFKLIAGLVKSDTAKISIDNNNITHAQEILANTFFMFDIASFYENLNAIDNLRIICKYRFLNENMIVPALKNVGLHDTKKKVKQYSHGMKQRLNLACLILSQPKLAILDEPLNGLDQEGIAITRDIIKKLNTESRTSFIISSHLLREATAFCSHYAIINKGQIVDSGKVGNNIDYLEKQYLEKITYSNNL